MTNTEKLIKVIEEKREEIIEASKKVYRDSMNEGYFQGWDVGILVDIDGEIDEFYRSTGTSTIAEFEGRAIAVINYKVSSDVGGYEIFASDLTDEEQEKFKQWLLDEEIITDMNEWESELNYDNLSDFDEDIITRIENEYKDSITDDNYYNEAEQKIEHTLQDLRITRDYN